MTKRILALLFAVAAPFYFSACNNDDNDDDGDGSPFVVVPGTPAGEVFGVTGTNVLVSFNSGRPEFLTSALPITGMQPDERAVAIDFRPSTGALTALTNQFRVYVIDLATAQATAVATTPYQAVAGPPAPNADLAADFNPAVDRIRVVRPDGSNLRVEPNGATLAATDTMLAYAAGDPNAGASPRLVACAYDRAFAGTGRTTLFAIDSNLDLLVTIGGVDGTPSPNGGQVSTVAALGVDTTDSVAFDVSPFGGALVALTETGAAQSVLYDLDLTTGALIARGSVGAPPLRDLAIRPPSTPRVFALAGANDLISFRPGAPGVLLSNVAVTGLQGGEALVGIDFRPASGRLFGLGSTNQVYEIDTTSGAATAVGGPLAQALAGTSFGVDFNPVADRIRVVSDQDQNLRINPATGALAAVDTALAYAAGDANAGADPNLVGSAYDGNAPASTSTTLYGIDSNLDVLVLQGSTGGTPVSPNTGQLTTVGGLGLDVGPTAGFDVSALGGGFAAFAAPTASTSTFYTINLATGVATAQGAIGATTLVRDIAVEPPLQPLIFGVTTANALISFRPSSPSTIVASVPVIGLLANENILAIDFRTSTRELIALTSTSRVYAINVTTGLAVRKASLPLVPGLAGTAFGADCIPSTDRIRVVSDMGQNLRVNANSGTVAAIDTSLGYEFGDSGAGLAPRIVALAQDKNFAATARTTAFGLDSDRDVLVRLGSPEGDPTSPTTGQLATVGALGVDIGDLAGLDITIFGGAYAAAAPGGSSVSNLYIVNLTTGAMTLVGAIGSTDTVRDIAFRPPTF